MLCIPFLPICITPPSSTHQTPLQMRYWELHYSLHNVGGITIRLRTYLTLKSDKHTRHGAFVISAELFPADIGLK